MNTNVGRYHCSCCGSIVEQEMRRLPPFCCGIEMIKVGQHGEHLVPRVDLLVPPPVAHPWVKTVGSRIADYESRQRTEFRAKQSL